jgi:hypothetical protein
VGEKLQRNSICRKKKTSRNLHSERLRTSNECIRLLSEVLSDQQAEMQNMVRQILHEDLNIYSYKAVMVQAINDQDTVNQKLFLKLC